MRIHKLPTKGEKGNLTWSEDRAFNQSCEGLASNFQDADALVSRLPHSTKGGDRSVLIKAIKDAATSEQKRACVL